MAALFELLFKYPPAVFARGELAFGAGTVRAVLAVAALAGLIAYVLVGYRRAVRGRDRGVPTRARALLLLRGGLFALLALCLLQPSIVVKAAVPQQNFLGVLVDDSKSFQIADRNGRPRADFVREQFGRGGPLGEALGRKFVLRYFRFSSSADRTDAPAALPFDGTATRLGVALDRAREELAGLPVAGLVVVSDGADTSTAPLDETIARLKSRSIPVYTIAVGKERFARDVQLTRVDAPRTTLAGNTLVVNVAVTDTGYAGRSVPLTVEDSGRPIASEDVTLPPDGETATIPVRVTLHDAGVRILRFALAAQPGEEVAQNNARTASVDVRNRREKILYVEGEPRFEAKFVRQAVEGDPNLDVVLLQRTAKDKYLRLGVDRPDELASGFPKSRDDLFAYRAIVLGSIEAASFTPEQIRMLADFVDRRGGGLLALGGRRAFAEGGWAGTPLADVLPVAIDPADRHPEEVRELKVSPTRDGLLFPLTALAATEPASLARWKQLPPLTTVNVVRRAKPGATVLLAGGDRQIVLAYQRYGRGTVAALPVQDVWQWRMNAAMRVDDTTHATFWRQLLRWLVQDVPGQVVTTAARDRVEPGEAVDLTARVADKSYVELNDARVVARVTGPSGAVREVALSWAGDRDGEYRGSFVAGTPGAYDVEIDADRGGTPVGTDRLSVTAQPSDAEYFDAAMRPPLLRRISEETGGRYFAAAAASSLPDAIAYGGGGVTVVEQHDLWDMPVVLLAVVGLAAGEWILRRRWGLA